MTILTAGEAFDAIRQGATLVTGSQRLSRWLTIRYDERQRASGIAAWPSADILPWSAWIERCWNRLWDFAFERGELPALLVTAAQEKIVWERVIDDDRVDRVALAAAAHKALSLLHEWAPHITGADWDATEDTAAFRDWLAQFRRELRRNNWIAVAELPDRLLEALPPSWCESKRLLLAGFNEFTPRQTAVVELLVAAGVEISIFDPRQVRPKSSFRRSCADADAELVAAAQWAARLLEAGAASVGVVVPALASLRSRVDRIFAQTLHPDSYADPEAPRAFNISLGLPLAEYPVVDAALTALDLCGPEAVPLEVVSAFLRSPFFGPADAERDARAALDRELRRRKRLDVPLGRIIAAAKNCPALVRSLRAFHTHAPQVRTVDSPARWASAMSSLLADLGWPGERPRNSSEYQTLNRWKQLLSSFAQLELVLGRITWTAAVAYLKRLAADDVFEPRSGGAPVQILGLLETTGLEFEHLWVTGLHDGVWPAVPHADPFLPLAAQRAANMPGSTNERELAFAREQTARLRTSAAHVVFSYPERDIDGELRPSRLIVDIRQDPALMPAAPFTAETLERVEDDRAPAFPGTAVRGGTSLLKDMAACPFRAAVRHRMHARPMEGAGVGLDPSDRGRVVHAALASLWRTLGSSEVLSSAERVRDAVYGAIAAALAECCPDASPTVVELERRRLQRLLHAWAAVEAQRGPFRILELEEKKTASVGGLDLQVRIDRIDEIPDGRHVVIDYKTGQVATAAWDGDRPEEPQLPLYASSANAVLAGVAFAYVRADELSYRGIAAAPGLLPKVKAVDDMDEVIAGWRSVLDALARAFREGDASVDPKHRACDNCDLAPLCRIHEVADDAAL